MAENQLSIRILNAVIQACLVGFVGSLPVSIAFCQISLGLGLASWLFKAAMERKFTWPSSPLEKGFIIFFSVCILATIFSLKPLESLVGLKKFYLVLAVYFVGFNIPNRERRDELVSLFIVMVAATGCYGILASVFGHQARLLGAQTMAMTSGGIFIMAAFLMMPSLLSRPSNKLNGFMFGLLATVLALSIVLNKTLSAWAGLLAGMMLYIFRQKLLRGVVFLLVFAAVFLSVALLRPSRGFFNYSKMDSWQARVAMWDIGWKLIKQRPILGTGLIDLGELYQKERKVEDIQLHGNNRRFGHLHNNFIHVTAITGFAGLTAFIFLWVVIISFILERIKKSTGMIKLQNLSYLAVMVGFLVNGLAEWNFGDSEVVTILWFVLGLALAGWRWETGNRAVVG